MEKKLSIDNLDPNKLWGKETKKSVIAQMTQMEERLKELEQIKFKVVKASANEDTKSECGAKSNEKEACELLSMKKKSENTDDWVQLITSNLKATGVPEVLQNRTYASSQ